MQAGAAGSDSVQQRAAMAGGDDEGGFKHDDAINHAYYVGGYPLALLFAIFLAISLAWEFLLAIATFLDELISGRKSLWIQRIKDEVLGLGVISLVLILLEPQLEKICVMPDGTARRSTHGMLASITKCPPGQTMLFSASVGCARTRAQAGLGLVCVASSPGRFVDNFASCIRFVSSARTGAHGRSVRCAVSIATCIVSAIVV